MEDTHELGGKTLGLVVGRLEVTKTLLGEGSGVWVETELDLLVLERVLLLDCGALGDGSTLGRAEDGLDFGAVDELGNVWLCNGVRGKEEVPLKSGWLGGGAVDLVQSLES